MLFLPAAVSGAWMRCTASSAGLRRASAATRAAISLTPIIVRYVRVRPGTRGAKLSFDPQVIDLDTVLDIFFTSHHPTSCIVRVRIPVRVPFGAFHADEQQREAFERAVARAQQPPPPPLLRRLSPWACSMRLSDYHQNYYVESGAGLLCVCGKPEGGSGTP